MFGQTRGKVSSTARTLHMSNLLSHLPHGNLIGLACTLHAMYDLLLMWVTFTRLFLYLVLGRAEGFQEFSVVFLDELSTLFTEFTGETLSILITAGEGQNRRKTSSWLHAIGEDCGALFVLGLAMNLLDGILHGLYDGAGAHSDCVDSFLEGNLTCDD